MVSQIFLSSYYFPTDIMSISYQMQRGLAKEKSKISLHNTVMVYMCTTVT